MQVFFLFFVLVKHIHASLAVELAEAAAAGVGSDFAASFSFSFSFFARKTAMNARNCPDVNPYQA
jgi:hypothetical protein